VSTRKSAVLCKALADDKLISSNEVPAFIMRDDLMDQCYQWSRVEAGEDGQRNFGMPMTVETQYIQLDGAQVLWGFTVSMYRAGVNICDLSVSFDRDVTVKPEYVGMDANGFPTPEGKRTDVVGKNFEIW
jgi:hypothetical protein